MKRYACGHNEYDGSDSTEAARHQPIARYDEDAQETNNGWGNRYFHNGFSLACGPKDAREYTELTSDSFSALRGFRVTCQADDGDPGKEPYAWEFGIQGNGIGPIQLHEMEDALPYLRKIAARLNKLNEEAGPAASFGAYCQRIASVLGVKFMLANYTREERVMFGENVRRVALADMGRYIDRRHHEWRECVAPTAATA